MKRDAAIEVRQLLTECIQNVVRSVDIVAAASDPAQAREFREAAAQALGFLSVDLLAHIVYSEHPDLIPDDLRRVRRR
jgi:hypothetical protein